MSDEVDPACWHIGDGPGQAYRMLANAYDGQVTMKIMGDTLATTPQFAREFAARLLKAAAEADK